MDQRGRSMKKNLSNETYLQTVWRRFRHHHLAVVSIVVVAVISLAAVLAPILAPYDPQAIAGPLERLRRRNSSWEPMLLAGMC